MRTVALTAALVLLDLSSAQAHPESTPAPPPAARQVGVVITAAGGEVLRSTERAVETIKITPEMSSQLGLAATHFKASGLKITAHIHEQDDEAFFVHRGGGMFTLGDRKVPIAEGDIVFIPKGVVHAFENTTSDTYLVWAISSSKYLELHRMFFSGADPGAAEIERLYKKYGFREATIPP